MVVIRNIRGEITIERRYFLSSLALNVKQFAEATRNHWGIENSLHWVFDVVFKEDQSRIRTGFASQNLAALRRMAINALKCEPRKRSLRLKLFVD